MCPLKYHAHGVWVSKLVYKKFWKWLYIYYMVNKIKYEDIWTSFLTKYETNKGAYALVVPSVTLHLHKLCTFFSAFHRAKHSLCGHTLALLDDTYKVLETMICHLFPLADWPFPKLHASKAKNEAIWMLSEVVAFSDPYNWYWEQQLAIASA